MNGVWPGGPVTVVGFRQQPGS